MKTILLFFLLFFTDLPRVVLQPRPLNDHLKTYNYHSYNPQPQANLNMKPHNNHHHFISNEDLYSQRLALNLTGRLYCPVEANPHNYVVLWYKGDLQLKMGNDPRYKVDGGCLVWWCVVWMKCSVNVV